MKKLVLLTLILLCPLVLAKELPSWGMTEQQFKMPNFETKMQEIGDQAIKNNWLLKITAPKDWHNKIRSGLSRDGKNNVQINFKDSLYKSISMMAAPGMDLSHVQTESAPIATAKKQVVIEKPEMDTNIEAPEFDNSTFNTGELISDIGELELTLPNGQSLKTNGKSSGNGQVNAKAMSQEADAESPEATVQETQKATNSKLPVTAQEQRKVSEQNLRQRYARGKAVDKSISYNNITEKDDLYVEGTAVLVKRYVNRGVAIYFWMVEDYDPKTHSLEAKGSGKFQKTSDPVTQQMAANAGQTERTEEASNSSSESLGFIAVTDQVDVQDKLRRDFIRNKPVTGTLKSSQLSKGDLLYVNAETVLIERPIGNSQSSYYWLEGETTISREVEQSGPQKYVIK